jgi:membrane fusion protein
MILTNKELSDVPKIPHKILILFFIIIFISFLLILFFGTFQKKVSCDGYVDIPDGITNIVSSESGFLSKINIDNKSKVTKNQKLFKIDNRKSTMQEGNSLDRIYKTQSEIENLKAQINNEEKSSIEKINLLTIKRKHMLEKENLIDIQKQIHLKRMQNILPVLKREEKSYHAGLLTDAQYQNILESYSQHQNALVEALRSLSETKLDIDDVDRSIKDEYSTTTSKIENIKLQITEKENLIEKDSEDNIQFIRSPTNGNIAQIIRDSNSYVQEGQIIATILPDNYNVIVNMYVDSQSIGYIRIGMHVRLRFPAYPYLQYGSYDGTVTGFSIAPIDTASKLIEKKLESISDISKKLNISYDIYQLEVKISNESLNRLGYDHPILPGMKVHGDIYTEVRRLYQWLYFPDNNKI